MKRFNRGWTLIHADETDFDSTPIRVHLRSSDFDEHPFGSDFDEPSVESSLRVEESRIVAINSSAFLRPRHFLASLLYAELASHQYDAKSASNTGKTALTVSQLAKNVA
jgi:hypothetical protein